MLLQRFCEFREPTVPCNLRQRSSIVVSCGKRPLQRRRVARQVIGNTVESIVFERV